MTESIAIPPPVPRQSHYHQVSVFKFTLLSVLTFQIYTFYWFYKCWKYVQRRDGGGVIPVVRTCFAPIFYFHLLADLDETEAPDGSRYSAMWAVLYLGLNICSALPDPYWMIMMASPIAFIPAVHRISKLNAQVSKPKAGPVAWIFGSLATLMGGFVLVVTILIALHIVPPAEVVEGDWLRESHVQFLRDNKILEPDEEILLFYSLGISIREDGQFLTNRRLVSYSQIPGGELFSNGVSYDNITGVRPQWSETWLDDTVVSVTTDEGYTFEIWLSNDADGDRRFVKELKRRSNLGGGGD